jgi:hypothetical protein
MGFDLYPLDVIDSRKRYYSAAIPEKWLTIFTHDAMVSWAYIQRGANGKLEAAAL